MLKLTSNVMRFEFPEVHPEAKLEIEFQRTFRIPDDGKTYPLPPGFGQFPVKLVDDCKDRVPAKWAEHGGVMVPMYQAEALWVNFKPMRLSEFRRDEHGSTQLHYPMAVRVAAGKVNAVSGKEWKKKLKVDDYVVVPPQPWLDGFCVEEGKIRQFVAMPLGWGLTVEQQVTGTEEHGGLQIEVYPMEAEEFERRFKKPKPRPQHRRSRGILRGEVKTSGGFHGGQTYSSAGPVLYDGAATMDWCCTDVAAPSADMGLGAGGMMKQQIHEDPFGKDVWVKRGRSSRVFVHLANSFAWEAITGHKPPPTPCTAEVYEQRGLPWFDHYMEGMPIQKGGKNLKAIKSVMALGFQKGIGVFPSNESVKVKKKDVIQTAKEGVRNGTW